MLKPGFAAFGFSGSQEIKDAGVGNLGLRDREANFLCYKMEPDRTV